MGSLRRLLIVTVACGFAASNALASPSEPVDMRAFCRGVTAENVVYYPPRARNLRRMGRVQLDCAVGADNHFDTCLVLNEEPAGWDFANHAMQIACTMYRDPRDPLPTSPPSPRRRNLAIAGPMAKSACGSRCRSIRASAEYGTNRTHADYPQRWGGHLLPQRSAMNSIIYLIGLIVVVLAILSFVGIR